jgi:hypothetical protein
MEYFSNFNSPQRLLYQMAALSAMAGFIFSSVGSDLIDLKIALLYKLLGNIFQV